MLNTFEKTFELTEMRTFKHAPFFIAGGGGGELIRGTLRYLILYTGRDNRSCGLDGMHSLDSIS